MERNKVIGIVIVMSIIAAFIVVRDVLESISPEEEDSRIESKQELLESSTRIELFGFVTELLGDGVIRVTMPPSEATEYREVFAVPSDVVEVDGVMRSPSTSGLGLGDVVTVVGYIVPGSAAQYGGVPILRIDAPVGPYRGVTKLNQPE